MHSNLKVEFDFNCQLLALSLMFIIIIGLNCLFDLYLQSSLDFLLISQMSGLIAIIINYLENLWFKLNLSSVFNDVCVFF